MRRSGWSFFVAFRVFVAFTGRWGLDVCGVYSVFIVYGVFGLDVCSVYEAFALVFFFWWGAGGGGRLECL